MAKAKIGYTWGREAASEYGEDLAGVRGNTPKNQFLWPVSAYDEHHRLFRRSIPGLWPRLVPAIRKCRLITSA